MCFDFGALKMQEGFSTIPFKSIHRDFRNVGAQGGRIEDPLISMFLEGPNVRGGGILTTEGPALKVVT